MLVSERAERLAALVLASLVLLGLEAAVLWALLGEGRAHFIALASVVLSLVVAGFINASPKGEKGRMGIKSTLIGFAVAVLGMALLPSSRGTAGAAQGLVVCFMACTWLVPQMAAQGVVASLLARLRNALLGVKKG